MDPLQDIRNNVARLCARFPEAYWRQVRAKPVRAVYRSPHFPALRVVDKVSAGPGDAINVGVNAARYPIVCVARTDCVLKRDSLRRLVSDFLEDASTIATGTANLFDSKFTKPDPNTT